MSSWDNILQLVNNNSCKKGQGEKNLKGKHMEEYATLQNFIHKYIVNTVQGNTKRKEEKLQDIKTRCQNLSMSKMDCL